MMQADGGEHGSGCYEDRASVKTPATHSQRRIRRHLPEIGGEVQQRPGQRRDAKSESDRGRDGGKSVARRLEWGMRVGSAAFNGVGYRQEVPGTAPCKEGDYGSDGGETGAAGGDNRSRMVSGITSRKAMAPQQQPAMRGALGEDEAVDSRDVGGSKPAGIAAAAAERNPILVDSDLEEDYAGQKKATQKASEEACVHGSRGQLSLVTEERTTSSPIQQYFDVVGRTLDQMDAPHDGLHERVAAFLSGFACVIRAGSEMALEMKALVAALETERDALRADGGTAELEVGEEMPEWLSDAEGLLQVSMVGEAAPTTAQCEADSEAAEGKLERLEGRRCTQAATRIQRVWRRRRESAAKKRVEDFFANAMAEEAWRRALAEFEGIRALTAVQEAAEAAGCTEKGTREQRKAEAKARLELREAEERQKREAREAKAAAGKKAAQAARAISSLPSTPPHVSPLRPAALPLRRRLFPSWGASQSASPQAPQPQSTDPLSLTTAHLPTPRPADLPSPQSFLPSWRHAHAAACTLQRAWHRRVQRAEAAAEARAAIIARDRAAACRPATLEAEKAAMEDRTARNIATARAFRRLEAELREQGIRIANGVGTGGRQRKRLHERRRAERMAEDLLRRELGDW